MCRSVLFLFLYLYLYTNNNNMKKELNDLDDILSGGLEDFAPPRPPVCLSKAKIRSKRAIMRELTETMLHMEDENGDSRLEKVLDALIERAENGDIKAVEVLAKILKVFDDKQKVDVNIPDIKIVIDNDKSGIRYTEK